MKNYVKPEMQVEVYSTNNCYAIKCENESGYTYKFDCNARNFRYNFLETNGEPGLQTKGDNPDKLIYSSYWGASGCNIKHEASSLDDFQDGYIVTSSGLVVPIIVWIDEKGNPHGTEELDKSKWEKEVPRS